MVRLVLAPARGRYLRRNALTVASLALPALPGLRVLRAFRLLRLLMSVNRGMRSLGGTLRRRGFGYMLLLTLVVALAGAAGILAFERETHAGARELRSYGDALWWTAMLLVTMGSGYWPLTPDGRLLCLLLSVYGFSVFGYLTATLASCFISRDAVAGRGHP